MTVFKNKNINYLVLTLLTLALLAFLFGYGLYRYHWNGPFIYRLARVVPYPAVFVDWEVISYRAYLDDLRALEKYWAAERENSNVWLGIPDRNEIRERLINKLIEEKIVRIWARARGLAVNGEELAAEWQRLQTSNPRGEEVNSFLARAYGWNEEKFKARVLEPFLLEQKVKSALVAENKTDDETLRQRAQVVYEKALAGKDNFPELAREYSDDRVSARRGGDLGYFPRSTFEPQMEQAIFNMTIGDISAPLKSSFGYHIIKLDDLLYDDNGTATQAAAKQILIKAFDFDDWLEQQKSRLPIYRLVL